MGTNIPRIVIGGLGGGSGKTIVSLGIIRTLRKKGLKVRPFKKGPDYIDASWLSLAAGVKACNLDPFFMDETFLLSLFYERALNFDISVIEGNRGIFDGLDVEGSCSTSHLAKTLNAPVTVVVDCTKVTRTVAALLLGLNQLEDDFRVRGVIFNRVAGPRHRKILTRSVEKYTDVEVLGSIPKLKTNPIPERYMGLISDKEYESEKSLDDLSYVVQDNVDIGGVVDIAKSSTPISTTPFPWPDLIIQDQVNIGVIKDSSLWFYYEENLELLKRLGANLVEMSLLSRVDKNNKIHGLYLGGGFPETQAKGLSKMVEVRDWIRKMASMGMPIYAECGGLMYLCKEIVINDVSYPMAGIFPHRIEIYKKPQGHGYTRAEVVLKTPFFTQGARFVGHEFHYSRCVLQGSSCEFSLKLTRGSGILDKMDGLVFKNTFASYNHIHALHIPAWGKNFVRAAKIFKDHIGGPSRDKPCPKIEAIY